MKYRSDEEILLGCLHGDRKSQAELYQKYAGRMMSLCQRYTRNRSEAEDVFHEAFIKVFNNLHHFKLQNSLEGWIRRIMVNTAINHYQKHKKHFQQSDIESVHETFSEEPTILSAMSNDELMELVGALPPGYKMVFNLAVIEGYAHKEIAEILGISEGTSKSQLAKAKIYLQKLIEKKMSFNVAS